MNKHQNQYVEILKDAWKRTMIDYQSGKVILKRERDLEQALATKCMSLMNERNIPIRIGRQELFRDKRVDIRLGPISNPILVELKLYHDKADWKESKSMRNTVESDLKFAKDHEHTYVGIVDVIPNAQRTQLGYSLFWKELELDRQVFNLHYAVIHPATSPPRERIQKSLLVNGLQI